MVNAIYGAYKCLQKKKKRALVGGRVNEESKEGEFG
jgi:hypothetical protein